MPRERERCSWDSISFWHIHDSFKFPASVNISWFQITIQNSNKFDFKTVWTLNVQKIVNPRIPHYVWHLFKWNVVYGLEIYSEQIYQANIHIRGKCAVKCSKILTHTSESDCPQRCVCVKNTQWRLCMRDDWSHVGDRKCISFHINGITFSSTSES